MTARIPQSVREEQLDALPGKHFVRWADGTYENCYSRAVMACAHGHEWAASVTSLVSIGSGCPDCAGTRRISKSTRELQLKKLIGKTFVRWVGEYKNSKSRASMRCDSCTRVWDANLTDLVYSGSGCPYCSGSYRPSEYERIAQLNDVEGVEFLRWDRKYVNSNSKALLKCPHGHTWSAAVSSILSAGSRCPSCAGVPRYSAKEREDQLRKLTDFEFVRWAAVYENASSLATMRCVKGHEWSASVKNLLHNKSGCPRCSTGGFDQTRPGILYALRSECGSHIKIGISNVGRHRLTVLRNATPFEFNVIGVHKSPNGKDIRDLEKMFHANFESSGFTGFDGATEWLKFDPDILSLLCILGA